MSQLIAPTVSLDASTPNLAQQPAQIQEFTRYSKEIDRTPDLLAMAAEAANVIDQFYLGRESARAQDELNKLKIDQSKIMQEMKLDPNDWTPERQQKYQDRINQAAETHYANVQDYDFRVRYKYGEEAKRQATGIAERFHNLGLEKQFNYETKVLTGNLGIATQEVYDNRENPKAITESLSNLDKATKAYLVHAGYSEGSDAYKVEYNKLYSAGVWDSLTNLLDEEKVGAAQNLFNRVKDNLSPETARKYEGKMFSVRKMLEREAEAKRKEAERERKEAAREEELRWARRLRAEEKYNNALAKRVKELTKLKEQEAKERDKQLKAEATYRTHFNSGHLTTDEMIMTVEMLKNDKRIERYNELRKQGQVGADGKLLPELAPGEIPAITLSPEEEHGIVAGLEAILQKNRDRYNAKGLCRNAMFDIASRLMAAGVNIQDEDPSHLLDTAVNAQIISNEQATSLYSTYQGMTNAEQKEVMSLYTNAPQESDSLLLSKAQALSQQQKILFLATNDNPVRAAIEQYHLSLSDAQKLVTSFENAKEAKRNQKSMDLVSTMANSSLFINGKTGESQKVTVLGEELDDELSPYYKKSLLSETKNYIQDLLYQEALQIQSSSSKNLSMDDILDNLSLDPKFLSRHKDEIVGFVNNRLQAYKDAEL